MNQLSAAEAPASFPAAPPWSARPVSLRPGVPHAALSGDNVLQMLELLPQALLVVQGDRTVLVCNRRAHGMAATQDIRIVEGRLAAVGQLGTLQVHQALQNAHTTGSCDASLWFQGDLATGWMRITALPAGVLPNTGGTDETLLVVVQLDQPALTQAARIDALARHSRLSATERHVLMLLGDGMTVEIAATHLGLCMSTLRSHVRNLLGKTQASSLMQLLRWVGSGRPLPH